MSNPKGTDSASVKVHEKKVSLSGEADPGPILSTEEKAECATSCKKGTKGWYLDILGKSSLMSDAMLTRYSSGSADSPIGGIMLQQYRTQRAYAIIINNKNYNGQDQRRGSEEDVISLTRALLSVGVHEGDMEIYENFKALDMNSFLNDIRNKDFTNFDCVVVAVFSHGDGRGVQLVDNHFTPYKLIIQHFQDRPDLNGKPKVFFFQSCRGQDRDEQPEMDEVHTNIIPKEADVLIAFATVQGYVAYREEKGSPFVQMLSYLLMAHGTYSDLVLILTGVNMEISKWEHSSKHKKENKKENKKVVWKQMSTFTSTFRKRFLFNSAGAAHQ